MGSTAGEIDVGHSPRRSLAEIAYDTIEQMIISRHLTPGAMVSESELGADLSLGRTPVREAIARLKTIGFVEVHPRRGVLVTHIDVIRHVELLEVRKPLDETVVRCLIRRGDDKDMAELRVLATALAVSAARKEREPYFRAKRFLHEAQHRAAGNTILAATMLALHAQSRRFWYSYEPSDRFGASAQFHADIVEGVAARDEPRAIAGVDRLFTFLDTLTRESLDRRPLA